MRMKKEKQNMVKNLVDYRVLREYGHSQGCACVRCIELRKKILKSKYWKEIYKK